MTFDQEEVQVVLYWQFPNPQHTLEWEKYLQKVQRRSYCRWQKDDFRKSSFYKNYIAGQQAAQQAQQAQQA